MGDLSRSFSRHEFRCKCRRDCGCDTVDAELIHVLQALRDYYQARVTINSGHRCEDHNTAVGGAPATASSNGSMHLYGRAADFVVDGVRPQEVQAYLQMKYPDRFGLGMYQTWTHIDTREGPARW